MKLRAVERSVGVVVHLGERGIDVLAEARAARDAAGEGVEEPHGRRDAFWQSALLNDQIFAL